MADKKVVESLVAVYLALQPFYRDCCRRVLCQPGFCLPDIFIKRGAFGAIEIEDNVAGEILFYYSAGCRRFFGNSSVYPIMYFA